MMDTEELELKEAELRKCYCKALEGLDVGGSVSLEEAKRVRLYGALWHHAHELLKAHEAHHEHEHHEADTLQLKATGIKSIK